ncbi:5-methylcytosine rRNA methyltransferase NSUN4 [Toxorhynchites rutilus septentrionalis]|uniref:5-methylcytosine rRNA methyltransferase NSUN4 n=1 Tax=Toxorhynchites rutilus septentrionalis TaxID=329112 RepID=UPI0024799799|nr:5-methylcytosine rRNA methyltransferase NSUN4 [Toxorhynchites rutilus septentrionalis]
MSNKMLRVKRIMLILGRNKHSKTHWSQAQKKQFSKDRALENFDDFYGQVFGNRWKSIRVALLTEHKYMGLVNQFGDSEETVAFLEAEGAINLRDIYNAKKSYLAENAEHMSSGNKVFKIDQRVEAFAESQRAQEVERLYKDDEAAALHKRMDNEKMSDESVVDFKKSLSRTLQENTEMDYQRLIDPNIGTSALHEFIPATSLKGMEDYVPESDHYKYYSNQADFPLSIEMEQSFDFPENLNVYTYEKGNVSTFRPPRKCSTGVLSHFLFDGASILPALALDVQPGDRVLDACAAPGGKSLLLLQTLRPGTLVCNDLQESRVNRIKRLMNGYFYDFGENWKKRRCFITQADARHLQEYEMYDRILVDVPCTTDRHSVTENDNNIFKTSRVKERLRKPEEQAAILANCLKLLRPGGTLVYSTCSLSPVQNDGVVHMALSSVFSDTGMTVTVKELNSVMQPFSDVYKFAHPNTLKYGQLVLPFLPANFGPMYFCKLVRNIQ